VAVIQLVGSGVSVLVTEKVSRKLLYSISCCTTMFGLLAFGTHGFLKGILDITQIDWIPIASMSLVIFAASVGILPLTFIMLSELLPLRVRASSLGFVNIFLIYVCFLVNRFEALAFHSAQVFYGLLHFFSFDFSPQLLILFNCMDVCLYFV